MPPKLPAAAAAPVGIAAMAHVAAAVPATEPGMQVYVLEGIANAFPTWQSVMVGASTSVYRLSFLTCRDVDEELNVCYMLRNVRMVLEGEQRHTTMADYGITDGAVVRKVYKADLPTLHPMQIFVKGLNGVTMTINASPLNTCREIKEMVEQKTISLESPGGILVEHQRLIWSGKQLKDHRTLGSYDIQEGSTLFLVLRLRGGGDAGTGSSSAGPDAALVAPADAADVETKAWGLNSLCVAFRLFFLVALALSYMFLEVQKLLLVE